MQRFRLMLISQVWKFARRSNVCSALKKSSEDVLRQVLGFVVPANETVRHVEDLARVLADHLIATAS